MKSILLGLITITSVSLAAPFKPVCNRPLAMREGLHSFLNKNCEQITEADIRSLPFFEFPKKIANVIQPGDLDGFEGLESLVVHKLGNRDLRGIFDKLTNLKSLKIDFLGQDVVAPRREVLFPTLNKLQSLDLRNVRLVEEFATEDQTYALDSVSFENLTELKTLVIARANVSFIALNFPEAFPKLEQLNLMDNKIEFFVGDIFEHSENLKLLNLGTNSLKDVERLVFPGSVEVLVMLCKVPDENALRIIKNSQPQDKLEFEMKGCH